MKRNVYLIGYRACGKTTLGKALSWRMRRPFIDIDEEIVRKSGMTIRQMVAEKGWDFFRQKEREIMQTVCRRRRQVVATGGGVVLDERNVADMKASGTVVWLRSRAETVKKWIVMDRNSKSNRPALTSKNLLDEIDTTLAERMPLYRSAMHFVVDTDEFDVKALTHEIREKLKAMGIE